MKDISATTLVALTSKTKVYVFEKVRDDPNGRVFEQYWSNENPVYPGQSMIREIYDVVNINEFVKPQGFETEEFLKLNFSNYEWVLKPFLRPTRISLYNLSFQLKDTTGKILSNDEMEYIESLKFIKVVDVEVDGKESSTPLYYYQNNIDGITTINNKELSNQFRFLLDKWATYWHIYHNAMLEFNPNLLCLIGHYNSGTFGPEGYFWDFINNPWTNSSTYRVRQIKMEEPRDIWSQVLCYDLTKADLDNSQQYQATNSNWKGTFTYYGDPEGTYNQDTGGTITKLPINIFTISSFGDANNQEYMFSVFKDGTIIDVEGAWHQLNELDYDASKPNSGIVYGCGGAIAIWLWIKSQISNCPDRCIINSKFPWLLKVNQNSFYSKQVMRIHDEDFENNGMVKYLIIKADALNNYKTQPSIYINQPNSTVMNKLKDNFVYPYFSTFRFATKFGPLDTGGLNLYAIIPILKDSKLYKISDYFIREENVGPTQDDNNKIIVPLDESVYAKRNFYLYDIFNYLTNYVYGQDSICLGNLADNVIGACLSTILPSELSLAIWHNKKLDTHNTTQAICNQLIVNYDNKATVDHSDPNNPKTLPLTTLKPTYSGYSSLQVPARHLIVNDTISNTTHHPIEYIDLDDKIAIGTWYEKYHYCWRDVLADAQGNSKYHNVKWQGNTQFKYNGRNTFTTDSNGIPRRSLPIDLANAHEIKYIRGYVVKEEGVGVGTLADVWQVNMHHLYAEVFYDPIPELNDYPETVEEDSKVKTEVIYIGTITHCQVWTLGFPWAPNNAMTFTYFGASGSNGPGGHYNSFVGQAETIAELSSIDFGITWDLLFSGGWSTESNPANPDYALGEFKNPFAPDDINQLKSCTMVFYDGGKSIIQYTPTCNFESVSNPGITLPLFYLDGYHLKMTIANRLSKKQLPLINEIGEILNEARLYQTPRNEPLLNSPQFKLDKWLIDGANSIQYGADIIDWNKVLKNDDWAVYLNVGIKDSFVYKLDVNEIRNDYFEWNNMEDGLISMEPYQLPLEKTAYSQWLASSQANFDQQFKNANLQFDFDKRWIDIQNKLDTANAIVGGITGVIGGTLGGAAGGSKGGHAGMAMGAVGGAIGGVSDAVMGGLSAHYNIERRNEQFDLSLQKQANKYQAVSTQLARTPSATIQPAYTAAMLKVQNFSYVDVPLKNRFVKYDIVQYYKDRIWYETSIKGYDLNILLPYRSIFNRANINYRALSLDLRRQELEEKIQSYMRRENISPIFFSHEMIQEWFEKLEGGILLTSVDWVENTIEDILKTNCERQWLLDSFDPINNIFNPYRKFYEFEGCPIRIANKKPYYQMLIGQVWKDEPDHIVYNLYDLTEDSFIFSLHHDKPTSKWQYDVEPIFNRDYQVPITPGQLPEVKTIEVFGIKDQSEEDLRLIIKPKDGSLINPDIQGLKITLCLRWENDTFTNDYATGGQVNSRDTIYQSFWIPNPITNIKPQADGTYAAGSATNGFINTYYQGFAPNSYYSNSPTLGLMKNNYASYIQNYSNDEFLESKYYRHNYVSNSNLPYFINNSNSLYFGVWTADDNLATLTNGLWIGTPNINIEYDWKPAPGFDGTANTGYEITQLKLTIEKLDVRVEVGELVKNKKTNRFSYINRREEAFTFNRLWSSFAEEMKTLQVIPRVSIYRIEMY